MYDNHTIDWQADDDTDQVALDADIIRDRIRSCYLEFADAVTPAYRVKLQQEIDSLQRELAATYDPPLDHDEDPF